MKFKALSFVLSACAFAAPLGALCQPDFVRLVRFEPRLIAFHALRGWVEPDETLLFPEFRLEIAHDNLGPTIALAMLLPGDGVVWKEFFEADLTDGGLFSRIRQMTSGLESVNDAIRITAVVDRSSDESGPDSVEFRYTSRENLADRPRGLPGMFRREEKNGERFILLTLRDIPVAVLGSRSASEGQLLERVTFRPVTFKFRIAAEGLRITGGTFDMEGYSEGAQAFEESTLQEIEDRLAVGDLSDPEISALTRLVYPVLRLISDY